MTILSVLFVRKHFKKHMMFTKAMVNYNHHDNNDKRSHLGHISASLQI